MNGKDVMPFAQSRYGFRQAIDFVAQTSDLTINMHMHGIVRTYYH